MVPNERITLSNLPIDIIRTIARIEEESIQDLRLISKSWNNLILELVHNRQHPLTIHAVIAVRNRWTGVIDADVKVRQEFAPRVEKLLPDWEQVPYIENNQNFVCFQNILHLDVKTQPESDKSCRKAATFWGNKISVAEEFNMKTSHSGKVMGSQTISSRIRSKSLTILTTEEKEKLGKIDTTLRNLRRLFLKCSYVEYLNLRFFTASNLNDISTTFCNMPVKEIVFMFVLLDEQKRAALINVMRSINTAQCFIHAGYCTRRKLDEFLLEISKYLIMFELHKYSADIDINGSPSFEDHPFYGIPSHFWRAISRQMLGNGVHQFKLSDGKDCWIERIRPDYSLPEAQVKVRLDESF